MKNYKLIGTLNILVAFGQFIEIFIFYVLLLPKISILYTDFGLPNTSYKSGLFLLPLIFMSIANVIIGIKILLGEKKYLKFGKWALLIAILLTFLLFVLASQSLLGSIYEMTESL